LRHPVPDMTYNVFGGTLNLALSIYLLAYFSVLLRLDIYCVIDTLATQQSRAGEFISIR